MAVTLEDVGPKIRHEYLNHMDNAIKNAQDSTSLTPPTNAIIDYEMRKALKYSQRINQEKNQDMWVK